MNKNILKKTALVIVGVLSAMAALNSIHFTIIYLGFDIGSDFLAVYHDTYYDGAQYKIYLYLFYTTLSSFILLLLNRKSRFNKLFIAIFIAEIVGVVINPFVFWVVIRFLKDNFKLLLDILVFEDTNKVITCYSFYATALNVLLCIGACLHIDNATEHE